MGDTLKICLAAGLAGLITSMIMGAALDAKTAASRSLRVELAVQRLDGKIDQLLARKIP